MSELNDSTLKAITVEMTCYYAVAFYSIFCWVIIIPSLTNYLDLLDVSAIGFVYGVLIGVYALATAVSTGFILQFCRKYQVKTKTLFVNSFIINAIAMASWGYSTNVGPLVIIRLLTGATASLTALCRKNLRDPKSTPMVNNRLVSLFTGSMAVGYVVGPALGAVVMLSSTSYADGQELSGIIASVVAVIIAVACYVSLGDGLAVQDVAPPSGLQRPPTSNEPAAKQRTALDHEFVILYAGCFLMSVIFSGFVTISVDYYQQVLGWSSADTGYILSLVGVAYFISVFTNPRMLRRFSFYSNSTICWTAAFIASLLMVAWGNEDPDLPRVIIATLLAGFSYGLMMTLTLHEIGDKAVPNMKLMGEAFAWCTFLLSVSRLVGAVWVGIVLEIDPQIFFYGNLIIGVAGAIFSYNVAEKKKNPPPGDKQLNAAVPSGGAPSSTNPIHGDFGGSGGSLPLSHLVDRTVEGEKN